jgi:hypothetical protein
LRLNTASGRVRADNCHGEFDLNTASGRVRANDIVVDGPSRFNVASGSVYVGLAATAEHDMEISSASGRATLDYNGHPVKGRFEFLARYRKGRIACPFDFDEEDHVRRWGDRYDWKAFTRDGEEPVILIETGSGSAVLRD